MVPSLIEFHLRGSKQSSPVLYLGQYYTLSMAIKTAWSPRRRLGGRQRRSGRGNGRERSLLLPWVVPWPSIEPNILLEGLWVCIKQCLLGCGTMQSGRSLSTFRKNVLPPSSVSKCQPGKQNAVHDVTFQKTSLRVEILVRVCSFSFYEIIFQRKPWGIRSVISEPLLVRRETVPHPVACLETLIRNLNSVPECI
jgi:hypothetical protein